jgi:hypothetical protein
MPLIDREGVEDVGADCVVTTALEKTLELGRQI